MKNMILVVAMVLVSNYARAVCTSPVSRTNLGSFVVLTSTKYNADLNALYTQVNELPGDCITINTLSGAKIIDGTITNAKISSTAAIAPSKLAAPNYSISTNSGSFTTSSTSHVDVTNLSVSITTTGKPVEIYLVGDGANVSYIGQGSSANTAYGEIKILRGVTDVAFFQLGSSHTGSTTTTLYGSPGLIRAFDAPAAGTYTYKVTAAVTSGTYSQPIYNCRLVVREL